MSNPSPWLSVEEMHQLRWLLGLVLAAVTVAAASLLGGGFIAWSAACGALLALALIRPRWIARVPRWIHRAAFPAFLLVLGADLLLVGELVPAFLRLGLGLLTYRAWTLRRNREDHQLVALGLFVLVMTGLLTLSPLFGLALVVFTLLCLLLFTVRTLLEARDDSEGAAEPDWSAIAGTISWGGLVRAIITRVPRRAILLWFLLGVGVFPLAALIFFALPRFEMSKALYLERLLARRSSVGFTDTVSLGELTRLKGDSTIAFHFDPRAPLPPLSTLYWRMLTLDEYRNGSFRASTALKAFGYSPATRAAQLAGEGNGRVSGVIYLEPTVGQHLPLTGRFGSLDFTEEREFRHSVAAHLISLTRPPGSLLAYRVWSMESSLLLPSGPVSLDARAARNLNTLPLSTEDAQTLAKVRNSLVTDPLDRGAFVQAAVDWLARRHSYSLNSSLPAGTGDPLVRWMVSEQPGHCEFFAGSLVLLCRSAGIPARLVAGFAGGTYLDRFVVVRNSDAHAWVEVEVSPGSWQRVDPTAAAALYVPGLVGSDGRADTAQTFWTSWSERLRLAWYRRVVNFDTADQVRLLQGAKSAAEKDVSGAEQFWRSLPPAVRFLVIAVPLLGLGAVAVWRLRAVLSRSANPDARIRAKAGSWLQRLPDSDPELRRELERLRFGPRENWPAPEDTFRRARRFRSDLARR